MSSWAFSDATPLHSCIEIFYQCFQTISGAMSTLTPPVQLEKPENQVRVDWIQDCATGPDFDYPPEFYEHTEALWKDKGVQVSPL